MPPKRSHFRVGAALWALVIVQVIWRLTCFTWLPLNLSTWPGAGFECSALAFTGLLAAWFVLADGNTWRRGVGCMTVYSVLRCAQDTGVVAHSWPRGYSGVKNDLYIFRTAEDEVLYCAFVFALVVRALSGWRITRCEPATPGAGRLQFRLSHLLAFTGLVAVLFALARAEWFQKAGDEGFGEHQIIFLHSVTIALASIPALIILRPTQRWWRIALVFIAWASMPLLISGYFLFAQWFPWDWGIVQHLVTVVIGAALTAITSALVARWCGFRLQPTGSEVKRTLPDRLALPTTE
jgi:hypothetical protein